MALQKNITTKDNFNIDVSLKNVYIKVESVNATKNEGTISVSFKNEDYVFQIKNFLFTPSMGSDNFIKQAYLHLKSLPEFADAVDC